MASGKLLISNVTLFRQMAEEAAAKSLEDLNGHRTPKQDGKGFINHPDGKRTSFKEGMIAIAFSGMCLEALIRIATRQARDERRRFVSKSTEKGRYGGKLEAVGIQDAEILAEANHFNDVRDDLIHEEPLFFSTDPGAVNRSPKGFDFVAQDEAQRAVKLLDRVSRALAEIYGKKKTT
jgi:hypothetical protein